YNNNVKFRDFILGHRIEFTDKSISDANQLYEISGNKKYQKLAKELAALMLEDKTLVEEAEEGKKPSLFFSSTGDQMKGKQDKKEQKKTAVIEAKQPRNKLVKETQTKTEEVESKDLDDEIKKTKIKKETNDLIIAAVKKTLEVTDKENNIEDDTTFNSAKRSPVDKENDIADISLQRQLFDVFEPLFDKNSPIGLHGQLDPKLLYNFQYVMKYIRSVADQAGLDITEPAFNVIKGFYQSFIHATNPNADLYEKYLTFSYQGLVNAKFTHDNRHYVTIAKKDSVSRQRKDFSEEGRKHQTADSFYPTRHSIVATLNRAFEKFRGRIVEIDNNLLNPENLDYDKINVGTELRMIIPESSEFKRDGKIVKGAAILKKYHSGEKLTLDELRELPIDFVTADGIRIGGLSDESTVKAKIKGEKHNEERQNQVNKLLEIKNVIDARKHYNLISINSITKIFGSSTRFFINEFGPEHTIRAYLRHYIQETDRDIRFSFHNSYIQILQQNTPWADMVLSLTSPFIRAESD
ncbi:hypothetical protein LCGC14_2432570, partial [marine sediment metagenome]